MNFRKNKYAALAVGIVLIMLIYLTGCGDNKVRSNENENNVLKVMTINVWSGLNYEGTLSMGEYETEKRRMKRYRALLENINMVSPDVIAVNEANFLPDYVEKLAADLDYDCIYHVGIAGLQVFRLGIPWNLKEGDAILARKPLGLEKIGRKQLSGGGFIWNNLSFHTSDATQVLVGKITWNKKPVYLAVTHWHASPADSRRNRELLLRLKDKWEYSENEYNEAITALEQDNKWRMNEAEIMSEYLDTMVPAGTPLIVMGDFNAEIESREMQYFLNRGYFDAFSNASTKPGYTWDPNRNLNIQKYYIEDLEQKYSNLYAHLNQYNEIKRQRIDFVLVGNAVPKESVVESSICSDNVYEGVHPSDHFGVCANIIVK